MPGAIPLQLAIMALASLPALGRQEQLARGDGRPASATPTGPSAPLHGASCPGDAGLMSLAPICYL